MSRLASIAKAGFYATPPAVTRLIASHLSTSVTPHRIVRLLDPCCGEGLAAEYVSECLAAETYGVEIEADRAASSRQRLNHLIHGDGLGLKVTTGAWSLLYLNPPYDCAPYHAM